MCWRNGWFAGNASPIFASGTREIAAMTADTPQTDSVTLLREDRDR